MSKKCIMLSDLAFDKLQWIFENDLDEIKEGEYFRSEEEKDTYRELCKELDFSFTLCESFPITEED